MLRYFYLLWSHQACAHTVHGCPVVYSSCITLFMDLLLPMHMAYIFFVLTMMALLHAIWLLQLSGSPMQLACAHMHCFIIIVKMFAHTVHCYPAAVFTQFIALLLQFLLMLFMSLLYCLSIVFVWLSETYL